MPVPTEAPTPERLRKARREGRVARSTLLVSAAVLAGALATIGLVGTRLMALFRARLDPSDWARPLSARAFELPSVLVSTTLPLLLAALVVAVVIGFAQTGPFFAPRALHPKRRRASVSPFDALLFSVVAIVVVYLLVDVLRSHARDLLSVVDRPPHMLARLWFVVTRKLLLRLVVFGVIAGAVDFLYRRYALRRSLRTTRAEALRERREQEGDPRWHAERKRRLVP